MIASVRENLSFLIANKVGFSFRLLSICMHVIEQSNPASSSSKVCMVFQQYAFLSLLCCKTRISVCVKIK